MHGFIFSHIVSFFVWQFSSFLHCFFFCHVPQAFLRHSSFHFEIVYQPLILLSCNSFLYSLDSPILCLFGWDSSFLENFDSFHHFAKLFGVRLFRSVAIRQFWSLSLPRISRTLSAPYQNFSLPVHFFKHIVSSHMSLFPFSTILWYMFLAFSCTYCLFHTSCIDTCWPQQTTPFVLFLPAAAAICLLNFHLSVGDIPTAWAPQFLAGIMPASCNLTPTLMKLFLESFYSS